MRGMANKPASLMSYFYTPTAGLWSYKGTFTQAKEPTAPEGSLTFAGPGMAILHAAQAALQPGSNAQLISVGYGKGSITTVDYQKSGVYYPIFMNWAKQLKGKVTFAAIVIMLGVTDGEHLPSSDVPDFPIRAKQIVDDIRSDLDEPNLPVLFCDYEQGATGTSRPHERRGNPNDTAHSHAPHDDHQPRARPDGRAGDAGRSPLRHAGAQGLGGPTDLPDAVEGVVEVVIRG